MKRHFLLFMAVFMVATLQAEVVCYEYEYSYTRTFKNRKAKYNVDSYYKGKKMYWVVDKDAQSIKSVYPATSTGEYRSQNKAKLTGGNSFSYNSVEYDISLNHKEIRIGSSFMGTAYYYSRKRVFKAYDKSTQIYEYAPHNPKFKGEDGAYVEFRKWFVQEMPAQDNINDVKSITVIIEKDGSLKVEGIDTGLPKNEQLEQQVSVVLAQSPKWTPAYQEDGKTALRYRVKLEKLKLKRTAEGLKRDREKTINRVKTLCERWRSDIEHVCCQFQNRNIGGLTLEQLGERIKTAKRPIVVVAVDEFCSPSQELMQDWNMILKGYEGQYDFYVVLGIHGTISTLESYSKAFRTSNKNPSVLFVYNRYGMSEERVGYIRSEGVQFIEWFEKMMQKSLF